MRNYLLRLCTASLLGALVWFSTSLWSGVQAEKKICQSVVPLGARVYDRELLAQAEDIEGIRSITPVCELPVRIKADTYTMEAVLYGVALPELQMKVRSAQKVSLGRTPALLIGEKSLAGMTDRNGLAISAKKQKELLQNYAEIEWKYQLTGDGTSYGRQEEKEEEKNWQPCVVAAILSEPEDARYLSYEQACVISPESGKKENIQNILLTVRGESEYQRALDCFR